MSIVVQCPNMQCRQTHALADDLLGKTLSGTIVWWQRSGDKVEQAVRVTIVDTNVTSKEWLTGDEARQAVRALDKATKDS